MRNVTVKLDAKELAAVIESHLNKTMLDSGQRAHATMICGSQTGTIAPSVPNMELSVTFDTVAINAN